MTKICSHCQKSFAIDNIDQNFYQKIAVHVADRKFPIPAPDICADCRRQIRLAFRNERNLYQRNCSLCQKSMISIYAANKEFPVYCTACFWSDNWDPFSYGQDFDFNKSFFEQFKALFQQVPKLGLILAENENSEYNNSCAFLKNCYLCFDGGYAEDCYFGETFDYVRNCVDFIGVQHSELCYELINSSNCYNVSYSQFCQNCSDSYFLMDCIGCKHCFGCVNLQQKEYYIFNKPYSKEDYFAFINKQNLGSFTAVQKIKKQAHDFWSQFPKRAYRGNNNEHVSGDNISNSVRSFDCFECKDLEDCRYCEQVILKARDCHDIDKWGENTELCFNSSGVGAGASHVIASYYAAFGAQDIYHSAFCWHGCKNLFGCVSLNKQKEYCILNKQYSQEEYNSLVAKMIDHMQHKKEWGTFFPAAISAFGYNESVAQEYFPLSKEEALAQGFLWSELSTPAKDQAHNFISTVPDDIKDIRTGILQDVLICEKSGKPFQITKPELEFYRKQSIPLPRRHPNQRNADLKATKNPRHLWQSQCMRCNIQISTSYQPGKKAQVYCERCYQQAII